MFQVDGDRRTRAQRQVEAYRFIDAELARLLSVQPDHAGAESANGIAAIGPGPIPANSTMRTPASGPIPCTPVGVRPGNGASFPIVPILLRMFPA